MLDPFLQALEDRRLKREAERAAWNKRAAQLAAEGESDAIAKRVYQEMLDAGHLHAAYVPPQPDMILPPPQSEVQAAAPAADVPVKEMILAVLREAAPLGLTAAQIKAKAYLKFKKHVNPNTLTVSLGRYSKPKDGEPKLARCVGRIWFYVPGGDAPKARTLDLLNGGRHVTQ